MTQVNLVLQARTEQLFGRAIFYGGTTVAHARKMQGNCSEPGEYWQYTHGYMKHPTLELQGYAWFFRADYLRRRLTPDLVNQVFCNDFHIPTIREMLIKLKRCEDECFATMVMQADEAADLGDVS